MTRLHLEVVALQVGEDAVAVPLERQEHLHGVIARRDRAAEDWDVLLVGQGAALVLVLAVVLDGAVDDEERAHEAEGVRHLVVEGDLGA